MLFLIDGVEHADKEHELWYSKVLGHPSEPARRRIDSIEVEGKFWYFNTNMGVTICMHIPKIAPPWPEKKCNKVFQEVRDAITKWDDLMQSDMTFCMEALEKKTLISRGMLSAKEDYELRLTDVSGSRRSFDEYQAERARKARKEWKPEELPLCPTCIEKDMGHDRKPRDYCHLHEWFDPAVYESWTVDEHGKIQKHFGPHLIGWKERQEALERERASRPPAPEPEPPAKRASTPAKCDPVDVVIDCSRPPVDEIPIEQLQAFGQRIVAGYQSAAKFMETIDYYRLPDETKAWAEKSMSETKEYIAALRARKEREINKATVTPRIEVRKPVTQADIIKRVNFVAQRLKAIDAIWTEEKQARARPGEIDAVMEQLGELWKEYGELCEQIPKEHWPDV